LSTSVAGITSWAWDFGDGHNKHLQASPFTHIYNQAGSYAVKLTVTDAGGCTDSHSLPVNLLVTDSHIGFRADTFYCPAHFCNLQTHHPDRVLLICGILVMGPLLRYKIRSMLIQWGITIIL
jgi:hypothetical protein